MDIAKLALEDGTVYTGRRFGAAGETFGEVVFNTSMTGYQEVLTDPSYSGQIVTMTCPEIGNYGVTDRDRESTTPHVAGFIVREESPIASNWRAQGTLRDYFIRNNIVAIADIDTRALTRKLRSGGVMRGVIMTGSQLDEKALVDILTEPKNALVKQYQKLFEFEDVRLRFSDGALRAVARQALARKSGARGLRSILENVMLELMYDLPSRDDVEECVINEEVIEQAAKPLLVLKQEAESA